MADAELNIVLKLLDEASEEIKKSMGEVQKDTDKVKEKSVEANKKIQNEFRESTKQIRTFRRDVLLAVTVLGTVVTAVKQYAQFNKEARSSVDDLQVSITRMGAYIGQVLTPVMKLLTQAAKGWKDIFDVISGHPEKMFQEDEISNMIRARQEMQNLKTDLQDINTLFITGRITASEFYTQINQGQFNTIALRQQEAQQLQQLAMLTAEVTNRQVLDANRVFDEQMALLNEYKINYMAAHAGMRAFTVAVSSAIRENMTTALTGIITGAKTAKQAFSDLGKAMIEAIVQFMVQKLVAWALEKTLLAGTVAATSVAAAAIAAAWYPAALLAAVATAGGAVAAGSTALVTSAGTTAGLLKGVFAGVKAGMMTVDVSVENAEGVLPSAFHSGGLIRAHSGLAVDEVPIIAQTGEGILSRRGMSAIGGADTLNRLNRGESPSANIEVNINYPNFRSKEDIDELVNEIGFRIQKELRYSI